MENGNAVQPSGKAVMAEAKEDGGSTNKAVSRAAEEDKIKKAMRKRQSSKRSAKEAAIDPGEGEGGAAAPVEGDGNDDEEDEGESLREKLGAGEDVITQEIIREEKLLQQQAQAEEAAEAEKAQDQIREAATEEYEKMLSKRKLTRFNELLGKAGLYTNFLMQKLEAHTAQKTQRAKAIVEARSRGSSPAGPPAKKQKAEGDDKANQNQNQNQNKGGNKQAGVNEDEDEEVQVEDDNETEERQRRMLQPKLLTGGVLREYQRQGFEWLVSLYENGLNGILGDEMGLGKTIQCISLIAHLIEMGVAGPFLVVAPLGTIANWVMEFEKFAPSIPVVLYHGTPDTRAKLRAKKMKIGDKRPVIVTSFEMVMQDRKHLARYLWKYVIVDEGHRLKNLNSRLIRDLKTLPSSNRLLLTGTPLQNNLSELWSLLNFLLPQLFDDVDLFLNWFDFTGVDSDSDNVFGEASKLKILGQLHQILKPFLLRRLKCDVEADLPKKREYLVYAPMTAKQHKYYDALLKNELRKVLLNQETSANDEQQVFTSASEMGLPVFDDVALETTEERVKKTQRARNKANYKELSDAQYFKKVYEMQELEEASVTPASTSTSTSTSTSATSTSLGAADLVAHVQSLRLQNMMVQFRKVCNHPYLFTSPQLPNGEPRVDEELVRSSGKLLLMDVLVPELIARGHKFLVFSQFTSMLDILEDYFTLRNLKYCRIDGGVNYEERQAQIADFNTNENIKVFLLSTRAGSLGINLTAADTCIIYDSDWNPQMDLQAQDRVHRIGQKRPVIVYRLCTSGSFESVMLEKAKAKRRLEKIVIHKERFKKIDNETAQLQLAELAEILSAEEGERVDFANPNNVISREDLERILDRSDEAFKTKQGGKGFSVYDPQQSEAFSSE